MHAEQIELVQASWARIEPISGAAAQAFYAHLFQLDPGLRKLFRGDMLAQGARLMAMIGSAVRSLDRWPEIAPRIEDLGHRHVRYGVRRADYET